MTVEQIINQFEIEVNALWRINNRRKEVLDHIDTIEQLIAEAQRQLEPNQAHLDNLNNQLFLAKERLRFYHLVLKKWNVDLSLLEEEEEPLEPENLI